MAGDFPAQDSFPMFKSAKYWIAIYWGVALPMDAWAICFYTDHWTAHHGPKGALRTLPLSEISEVYLEPKTSAYFRIYRGKEVTQCTPTATTLASALWADAIFAVLQLHNDHDIKTIKDYFQAYQSFVHANRKQAHNNNNHNNAPRTKRQSIFGKMKEIFSSSSGDNHQPHPTNGGGGGEGSNSSGNEGGVFSSEGEATSPTNQQHPPLQRSKSSRAIRRWTTAVGGAFLNRSKSADDGLMSAAANDQTVDDDSSSVNNKKSPSHHTTSMFFSPSSPMRRTSTTSAAMRRDSRSYTNPPSEGFLTQSVIDFHRPESASSLRMRGSSFSEDHKSYHSGDEDEGRHEGEEDGEDIRSRYTESVRNSKHCSVNSVFTEDNDNTHDTRQDTQEEETQKEKPMKSILVNALEEQKDKDGEKGVNEANNQKVQSNPEPRSIHDRLRHVNKTTTQNAYSSGDERQLHYKKKKPAHLRDIQGTGSNANGANTPGYFSDTHQIRHQVQHHPSRSHSSKENISVEEAKAHSQLEKNGNHTANTSNQNQPNPQQEYVPPRPPAAELGQFTVLDLIYAQNMATLTQQQQRQKEQEQEMALKKKIPANKHNIRGNSENNLRQQQQITRGEKRHDVTQELRSSPIRNRDNVSPIKASSSKQFNTSSTSSAVPQDKTKNRDTLLAEFLGGDFSTSFSLFSKKKAQQEQQQQQQQHQQVANQTSPKEDVKRQKGYLARALSSNSINNNNVKPGTKGTNSNNALTSMFRYGKDRANSATTDDEEAAQRTLQRQKYFTAIHNTDNANNNDKEGEIKPKSPILASKRRKPPPKAIIDSEDPQLAPRNDKPLELKDLLGDEGKDSHSGNINLTNSTNKDTPVQQGDTVPPSNLDQPGDTSPTSPEHKLFKVFHPNSPPDDNSPVTSRTPFAYTPSTVQLPGVSSPLMEVDSHGIQGMLSQLEAIRQQHSSQRPVHEKISLSNHTSSNNNRNNTVSQSSAEKRSPRGMGRHHSTGNMNMPLLASSSTPLTPGTALGPETGLTTSSKSPRSLQQQQQQTHQHTMFLQRKTPLSPRSPTTVKISVPVPYSTTIQATLAGYPVTLTLLTKNELRQKLLNRPNLLPMRPGLTLSPIKQRPVPSSPAENDFDSLPHGSHAHVQSARAKYLRQQQQEREALEVTAMTMMAIAAELLEGDCYLSIQRVSNTLYTSEVSGVSSTGGVKPFLSSSGLKKAQTDALLEDIVEEYVYIPLTRMMTLEVDESRSGLFRFLLSQLVSPHGGVSPVNVAGKKGLDACLYVRSFDLLPSESLFLSLFGSVIGVSAAASVATGHTSLPVSPSSPGVYAGHSHHAFEEAGGSAVGQRYNAHRVPQVKDPKRKVTSSTSAVSHATGLPMTPQSPSDTSFATLSFGGGNGNVAGKEGEYVSCVMKANSPEILPAFLQTMMYLRQTIAV